MLIHLVADYGHGDVAFAEVRQRLAQLVPEAEVFVTPVPAFDTVSAGFCAAQLALTDGPAGSQFRSRDLFPAVVAALARGDRQCLGGRVSPELLPPPPERAVAYVDGYGNLKTTWSQPPEAVGGQVQVRVGGSCAVATVTDGTFAVRHGEMSFAPGSSGWRRTDGGEVRFYELLLRGGSAARRLGNPGAGTPVDVRPVAERDS